MYTGFQHAHSFTAYLALAILFLAIVHALVGWLQHKPFTKRSKTIFITAMAFIHVQFLIGIILYFVSPLGFSALSGEAMSDALLRLYTLEHPLMMLIAIILITYGYSKAKRLREDRSSFKKISIFYGLGFVLILSRIPWNAWL